MVRVHSGLPFLSPAAFSTCDFLPVFSLLSYEIGLPGGGNVGLYQPKHPTALGLK